jgi:hypothetical protein
MVELYFKGIASTNDDMTPKICANKLITQTFIQYNERDIGKNLRI